MPPPPPRPIVPQDAGQAVQLLDRQTRRTIIRTQSRRASRGGLATFKICVSANGKIDGDPIVQTSSGYPALDEAAVKVAKERNYKPVR